MVTLAIDVLHSISSIESEWDELCDATNASPWLRPGWFACWADAFGSGSNWILTARRSGVLVGVLCAQRKRGVVRSAANWHSPEFGIAALDDRIREALVERALADGGRRCSLGFVDASAEPAASWDRWTRGAGFRSVARVLERSPYVATTGNWETYEAGLSKKLRSELRRRRKRLEERGAVEVEILDGSGGLEGALETGFAIEEAAWKGERGTAINSSEQTRRFYQEVARWAAERGWLRLCFLRSGEDRLVFDLSMETKGVHYLLKTGYDPDYRKLAPGMLMRREMLHRAFEEGLDSYEFLGSDNPWKLEWTDTVRERLLLQAFAPSVPGWIEWAAFVHGRPLAKKALARMRREKS